MWLLTAGWALLYWSASQMGAPDPPTVTHLVAVGAGVLIIGSLLTGVAQAVLRRSGDHRSGRMPC